MSSRTLYLLGSAAPPVLDVAGVVARAQADGWDVCLGLTPSAARWLEPQLGELERLTGHPVRSRYKAPGEPDVWEPPTVIALAPATFNTINQWALGITEKFVVGVLAEAIGKRIPLVAMPCLNTAATLHPQFERSVGELRLAGVNVLYGKGKGNGNGRDGGGFEPNEPGEDRPEAYPWPLVLDAVNSAVG